MFKYYKGWQKENGMHRIIVMERDDEHEIFDDFCQNKVEVYFVEKAAKADGFDSMDSCMEKYFVNREITENEFMFYRNVSYMLDEIYMNQYTGGFPRASTAIITNNRAGNYLLKTLKDMKNLKY